MNEYENHNQLCVPCQVEGGYRIRPDGDLYPPARSIAPYTGRQFHSDDKGTRVAEVWVEEPMCAAHGIQLTERTWAKRLEVSNARFKPAPSKPLPRPLPRESVAAALPNALTVPHAPTPPSVFTEDAKFDDQIPF